MNRVFLENDVSAAFRMFFETLVDVFPPILGRCPLYTYWYIRGHICEQVVCIDNLHYWAQY